MGHTSTVSRETPLPRPCTCVGTFVSSKVSPSLTLDLWSHVHSPQADPTSQILHLGLHVLCLQVDPSQPWTWDDISTFSRVTLLPRPFTWGHTSTASRLTPQPPPRPCTCGHRSTVSRVTIPPRLCTWDHVHILQGDTTSLALYGVSTTTVFGMTILPHPAPGFSCPRSPG